MNYERPESKVKSIEDLLTEGATKVTGGPVDFSKWIIGGTYQGNEGALYYVDRAPEGTDQEFMARRIAARINEAGGNVSVMPPKEAKAA